MKPFLTESREVVRDLDMIQFILPGNLRLPKPAFETSSLDIRDAQNVYENSEYRDYLSVDYIRDRIARGPSAAIHEKDRLVAWAITQDDGAMGGLHVLESHRKQSYGFQVCLALCQKLRSQGKSPFAYVEQDNVTAIRLMKKIGFLEQKRVHWLLLT